MNQDIKIGLLELGDRGNLNSLSATEKIIEYAIEADRLGFERFWLGEHHRPDPRVAFTNPEILISIIAGMTQSIRVGSAGTLISMYKPYSTLTNFKFLNNIFQDRIDLGLAKGEPVGPYLQTEFENHIDFHDKVESFNKLIENEEENYKRDEIVIPPFKGISPDLWYLSNTYKDFDFVRTNKLNFCRSIFHGGGLQKYGFQKDILEIEIDKYEQLHGVKPKVNLALAICLDKSIERAKEKYLNKCNQENIKLSQAWKVLYCTSESLYSTLLNYIQLFGINEFVILDMEDNNEKKMETINELSERLSL